MGISWSWHLSLDNCQLWFSSKVWSDQIPKIENIDKDKVLLYFTDSSRNMHCTPLMHCTALLHCCRIGVELAVQEPQGTIHSIICLFVIGLLVYLHDQTGYTTNNYLVSCRISSWWTPMALIAVININSASSTHITPFVKSSIPYCLLYMV